MADNQERKGKGQRLAENGEGPPNARHQNQEVQVRHPNPEPLTIPSVLANRIDMQTPKVQYFMRAVMVEGDLSRRFRGDVEEALLDIMSLCKQNPDSDQVFARIEPCFKGDRAPKTITASVAKGTTSISFDTTLAVGCTCGCEIVVVTYHYHLAQLHFKALHRLMHYLMQLNSNAHYDAPIFMGSYVDDIYIITLNRKSEVNGQIHFFDPA